MQPLAARRPELSVWLLLPRIEHIDMPNKPRGDATPVRKSNGSFMPVPYGPRQKFKDAKKKNNGANAILRAAGYGGRKKSKRA